MSSDKYTHTARKSDDNWLIVAHLSMEFVRDTEEDIQSLEDEIISTGESWRVDDGA